MTRNEFINFMIRAQQAVYHKLHHEPQLREVWEKAVGPLGPPANDPIFSFDHPNIHGGKKPGIVMHEMGLTLKDHLQLPVNSCDIHRMIEHTHARLVESFQLWLDRDSTKYSLEFYKRGLERLYYEDPTVASPYVLQKDLNGLPALFQEVIDINGAWPPKAWR